MTFMRTVTETTPTRASTCKAGDRVFMLYQSANRDEAVFDDARRVPRRPRPQPAPRLRHRHALLPGRQPGPRRDQASCSQSCSARLRDIRAVDAGRARPGRLQPGARASSTSRRCSRPRAGRERGGLAPTGRRRVAGGRQQRARILDAALGLDERARAPPARRCGGWPSACGLNVATIYHYFPSKADLLRALIEERRYGERMASRRPARRPPTSARRAVRRRSSPGWSARTLEEETVLRLLRRRGAARQRPCAQSAARPAGRPRRRRSTAGWPPGFPELAAPRPPGGGPAGAPHAAVARDRAPRHGPRRSGRRRRRPRRRPLRSCDATGLTGSEADDVGRGRPMPSHMAR